MRHPDVSVIVVNWNTCELLEACLKSVYNLENDTVVEVIVVDNASADRSVEMVRKKFPQVFLIENDNNLGFAKANNQALKKCRGRFSLLLNSDAEVAPETMRLLSSFLDGHPEVGAVGPKIMNPDGSFQSASMVFPTLIGEFLLATKLSRVFLSSHFPSLSEHRSQYSGEADWLSGACLMIRREAIDDVGGLDESYFMYSEEVDWCWKAKLNGWKIYYLAQAQVFHRGGQSIGQIPRSRRTSVYGGKVLFFMKNRGPLYASLFRLMILIITLMKMGLTATFLLIPKAAIRTKAINNLRSYSLLISEFAGA